MTGHCLGDAHHLLGPSQHYSTNFGASFAATSEKLLTSTDAGYIKHVGERPADSPPRLSVAVSGYSGFRPRTTPDAIYP